MRYLVVNEIALIKKTKQKQRIDISYRILPARHTPGTWIIEWLINFEEKMPLELTFYMSEAEKPTEGITLLLINDNVLPSRRSSEYFDIERLCSTKSWNCSYKRRIYNFIVLAWISLSLVYSTLNERGSFRLEHFAYLLASFNVLQIFKVKKKAVIRSRDRDMPI